MMMGADKISLNTSAIINPKLITEVSESYGAQAVVVSIDVKKMEKITKFSVITVHVLPD